jgi:hypothetical protein
MALSTTGGALTQDTNRRSAQFYGDSANADATATPQLSPLTVSTSVLELKIPENATQVRLTASGADCRYGDNSTLDGTAGNGYSLLADGKTITLPCADQSSIHVLRDAAVDVTLSFGFDLATGPYSISDTAPLLWWGTDDINSLKIANSPFAGDPEGSQVIEEITSRGSNPQKLTSPFGTGFSPAYDTSFADNGVPVADLNSGRLHLLQAFDYKATWDPTAAGDYTHFFVCKPDTAASNHVPQSKVNFAGDGGPSWITLTSTMAAWNGTALISMGFHTTSADMIVWSMIRRGTGVGDVELYRNGTLTTTTTDTRTAASNANVFTVGNTPGFTTPFDGKWGCYLYWDRALSVRENSLVTRELKRIWSLD